MCPGFSVKCLGASQIGFDQIAPTYPEPKNSADRNPMSVSRGDRQGANIRGGLSLSFGKQPIRLGSALQSSSNSLSGPELSLSHRKVPSRDELRGSLRLGKATRITSSHHFVPGLPETSKHVRKHTPKYTDECGTRGLSLQTVRLENSPLQ